MYDLQFSVVSEDNIVITYTDIPGCILFYIADFTLQINNCINILTY